MSTPLDQQTPPMPVTQQEYTARTGHGSVGPLIAVLAVITILGVIAGIIGRLCSGRSVMGHGQFDFEGWIERKCSSCLDGRIDPPPPRPPAAAASGGDAAAAESVPVAVHVETPQEERKQEEQGQPEISEA